MKPRDIFDKLVEKAQLRNIVGHPDYMKVQQALRDGKEIPDSCLPGRLLNNLSDEEREILKDLKSDQINDRI
jgi:hypothetical protein